MANEFIRWSDERVVYHASTTVKDIEEKAKLLGLDPEKISRLFLSLVSQGFLRGRQTEVVEAACFLVYIRQNNIPIPEKTISEIFGIPHEKIFTAYKDIVATLGIKVPAPSIESRIHYVVSKLNLSDEILRESLQLAEKYKDKLLGKNPNVVAAAIVWTVAKKHGLSITQKQLGELLHVTDAAIRTIARMFKKNQTLLASTH